MLLPHPDYCHVNSTRQWARGSLGCRFGGQCTGPANISKACTALHARGLLSGQTKASQSHCQWQGWKLAFLFMSAESRSTGESGRPGGSSSSPYSCIMVPADTWRRAYAWVGVRGSSTGAYRTANGLAHLSSQCAPRLRIRARPPNTHSRSD